MREHISNRMRLRSIHSKILNIKEIKMWMPTLKKLTLFLKILHTKMHLLFDEFWQIYNCL